MTRVFGSYALGCALLFAFATLHAEEIRDYYAEPGINPFKDALNQHFNEHVDPFSGTLQIEHTDLTIPGNGGMDINVRRVYTSLQTNDYPTLGLNGLGWTMHFGRIVTSRSHTDKLCTQAAHAVSTTENPSLERPDGGRELLVLNTITDDNTLITRSNWRAQCLSTGGGMLVTSPDGTRYTMNQYDSFQGEPSWMTTRIEDLHGNWIRIDYQVNAVGVAYIDKIYRSEEGESEPVVTYEYESPTTADIKLAAISANGQRVTYRYEPIPGFLFPYYEQLVEVVRPDGSSWGYEYYPLLPDPNPDDDVLVHGLGSFTLKRVDYPHGADVEYTYQWVKMDPGSLLATTSIHTKVVSGEGVTGGTWTYTFAPYSHPYPDGRGGELHYDVTTVTGPDDIQKFYHYGKDFRADLATDRFIFIRPSHVGTLARKETYSRNNVLLERTGYSWGERKISDEDFWHGAGYRNWWRDDGTYVPVLVAEYSDRDTRAADENMYLHFVQYFEHDVWGNPHRILESSSLVEPPPLQKRLTYHVDTTQWILHLVEDEIHEEVDGSPRRIGEIDRTYDAKGKLREQDMFGVKTSYTYTQRGDLESVEDARGNVHSYSNYKRGIARSERLPESVTISRTVNDTGTVASETNGRGYTTSFSYDDLNRLTGINFPIKADAGISYGSATGGYRRTLTRGSYRQVEVINDFGQVTRIERSDTVSGQLIYRTQDYDASGRQTFQSYPNSTRGITTTFDALGRVRRTQHPDGSGVDYSFDDIDVRVTNERGFVTRYRYQIRGVDFPGQTLRFIRAPEGVGTLIRKDHFNNTTRVFQGQLQADDSTVIGYGREYEYDSRQFLVRVVEPEIGTTIFTHDAVGNVLSERVNGAEPTLFTYDDLNRRTLTDFPGTGLDVVTIYDRNDNVEEVAKGTSHWVYGYDENDNLRSETLTVADPLFGNRSYVTSHAYNDQDFPQQITYPSGLVVDYAPDAFGRATKAGTFASLVTYHPSGQLQSYRLANGVVTNVALNGRLMTESIRAGSLVNLNYTYDLGGNVTSIVDGVDSAASVAINFSDSYDGLDRLVAAQGRWGFTRFSYDFYGNIVSRSQRNDRFDYRLDEQRRLQQVTQRNVNSSYDGSRIRMDFDIHGNASAKRRYAFNANGGLQSISDMQFTYAADSTLVKARGANVTSAQSTAAFDKDYLYDGLGQRFAEKKHGTYDIRYSIHGMGGQLLFEDSIAECIRTDYIRLGTLTLARSDDQHANPALDTDGDQINDCMERQLGLNPNNAADANADSDGDGLSNLQELRLGTSLLAGDTDRDGLSDFREANEYLSDPTLDDSDGDGVPDATEALDPRLDPKLADADHDGVSDGWELQLGTNPQDITDGRLDSDSDGYSNRQESLLASNPLSATTSPARGRKAWTFETFGTIYSSAAIGPTGVIYVAANSEYLYAINPDGTQRWRYAVPGSIMETSTVAPNGTIYVTVNTNAQDEIHAINPDGSVRWVYGRPGSYVRGHVVLGPNGLVYYALYKSVFENGNWVIRGGWESLNDSGAVVSSAEFANTVTFAPAVGVNGDVYISADSGDLMAFNEQGALRWTLPTGNMPGQAPVLDAMQRIYVSDGNDRLYAVSSQGQLLWKREQPTNLNRSAVTIGADGTLYIGAYDSKLYAVNPTDGSTIWVANTYGTAYTPAIARNGTIYVTTWLGSVSAFDPAGNLLWRFRNDSEVSAPPVLDRDGTLYFGSRLGQVFAVVDNGGGPADTPWPMFRHDVAGTSYVCFDAAAYSTTVDSDRDGIDNCSELKHGLDPNNPNDAGADQDGDGLSNSHEHANGTSISNPDTDADGLNDGQEVLTHHTDPLRADSDGDAINDGQEIRHSLNPLDASDALLDRDGDGFSNRAESWAGSDLSQSGSRPTPGTVANLTQAIGLETWPMVIAPDGTMYRYSSSVIEALDPSFKLKWRREVTDHAAQPSIAADGTLYTLLDSGRQLVALYPNGRERWKYQVEADGMFTRFNESPVIGSDGTLFVTIIGYRPGAQYNYHQIAAFDPLGRPKWRIETDYLVVQPLISLDRDGNVIAHTHYEGASKYRGENGELIWHESGDRWTHSASRPVIDADNTIYVGYTYGTAALDSSDGSARWSYTGAFDETVITPSGLLVHRCRDTNQNWGMCALRRDGSLAWSTSDVVGLESVVGRNGVIYLSSNDGLYAYDENGAQLWNVPLPYNATQITILEDGMIQVAGHQYRALIISDSRGLANSPWPTVGRDYQNSRSALGVGRVQPGAAPTLGITAPNPFRPLNLDVGQPFALTAYATDAVDGDLHSAIVWTSSIDGVLGQGPTLNSPPLSVGAHVITATVTDSNGLTSSDTVTINLGYLPPTITITSPIDGDVIERGAVVTLTGEADDAIDGDLSNAIQWSSDRDGVIGTGRTVSTTTLSAGQHVITARVTDSSNTSATATVRIALEVRPPHLTVWGPYDGQGYEPGTLIEFSASAYDSVDGDVSAGIEWRSSLDGLLYTGAQFSTSALRQGTHVITAIARDSGGAQTSETLTLSIGPQPPDVWSPDGFSFTVSRGSNTTIRGGAEDQVDGDLSASIRWTSLLDGLIGTGASISTASLSGGAHLVTLSVTDSSGLTATTQISIYVDDNPNRLPTVSISSPANNAQFFVGDAIRFQGSANDPDQGTLTSSIQWSSNLDGALGTGSPLTVRTLRAGDHTIKALVTDRNGAKAAVTRTIRVRTR